MTLQPGTRLGPYEIALRWAPAGWARSTARATRASTAPSRSRSSPRTSPADPELRQRFEREARAISALNHPHICVLHDVGRQDGIDYLVMEYLEGETLADRLKRGALPLEQALRYGIEIAEALDRAHRQGIVHRDLKPGNVMITKSGAEAARLRAGEAAGPRRAPALGLRAERAAHGRRAADRGRHLVGTFPYMSPEQLEGREPDARADVFAFGAVLYEMVTGRRAFTGKSQAQPDRRDPHVGAGAGLADPAAVAARPRPRGREVPGQGPRRALAERARPGQRARVDRGVRRTDAAARPSGPGDRARGGWPWGAGRGPGHRHRRFGPPLSRSRACHSSAPVTAALLPPPGITTLSTSNRARRRSPPTAGASPSSAARGDGSQSLWVRELSRPDVQELPETAGGAYPFWSPDSRRLGFFARGRLNVETRPAAPCARVCDAPYPARRGLGPGGCHPVRGAVGAPPARFRGAAATPWPSRSSSQEVSHRFPHFLPDGHAFPLHRLRLQAPDGETSVYLGSLGRPSPAPLMKASAAALYRPARTRSSSGATAGSWPSA